MILIKISNSAGKMPYFLKIHLMTHTDNVDAYFKKGALQEAKKCHTWQFKRIICARKIMRSEELPLKDILL